MNRSTLYLLIILLLAWIVLGAYLCKKYLCGPSASGDEATTLIAPVEEDPNVWRLNDGSAFSASATNTIDFGKSVFAHAPLESDVRSALNQASTYLKGHTDRGITIDGLYATSEENTTIFDNLGLARANNVKQRLVSMGAPAGQVMLASSVVGDGRLVRDSVFAGVNFAFAAATGADNARLERIRSELIGNPITLYFNTSSNQINLTSEQRQKFADMTYYLDNVAESTLQIGGHTDDRGDRTMNVNLSSERAQFVTDYLSRNGIAANRMAASGLGPDQPVASNGTAEGRAQNRRVEVILR